MVWFLLAAALLGAVSVATALESVGEGRRGPIFLTWHTLWFVSALVALIWRMPGGFL